MHGFRVSPCLLGWIPFFVLFNQNDLWHSVRIWIWFEQSNCRGLLKDPHPLLSCLTKFTKTVLLINCLNQIFVVTVLTTIFVSDFPSLPKVLTDSVHPPIPCKYRRAQNLPFFLPTFQQQQKKNQQNSTFTPNPVLSQLGTWHSSKPFNLPFVIASFWLIKSSF